MKIIVRMLAVAMSVFAMSPLGGVSAEQDTTSSDKDMTVLDFESPVYPPLARQTRIEGVVVVRAKLDSDGRVLDAVALSGNDLLIPESVANAKKWRFQPNAARAAIIVYNFRLPQASCKFASFSHRQPPNFVSITGCAPSIQ